MATKFKDLPTGAKILSIVSIISIVAFLLAFLYFLYNFYFASKDECNKLSDCHPSEYCKYISTFKHNKCVSCGPACANCQFDKTQKTVVGECP